MHGCTFFCILLSVGITQGLLLLFIMTFPDDPSPRLSAQAQAAEDILDKYRNAIKRTSPSEGALVNYDSGGENLMFIVLTNIVSPS